MRRLPERDCELVGPVLRALERAAAVWGRAAAGRREASALNAAEDRSGQCGIPGAGRGSGPCRCRGPEGGSRGSHCRCRAGTGSSPAPAGLAQAGAGASAAAEGQGLFHGRTGRDRRTGRRLPRTIAQQSPAIGHHCTQAHRADGSDGQASPARSGRCQAYPGGSHSDGPLHRLSV